tara:strand:- start:213 stop:431 length:219 start_codon:yes stop_codon:yes gene_type:complete
MGVNKTEFTEWEDKQEEQTRVLEGIKDDDLVGTLDMIFGQQNVFVIDEKTDFSESSELTKRMKKLTKKGGDE